MDVRCVYLGQNKAVAPVASEEQVDGVAAEVLHEGMDEEEEC